MGVTVCAATARAVGNQLVSASAGIITRRRACLFELPESPAPGPKYFDPHLKPPQGVCVLSRLASLNYNSTTHGHIL